MILSGTDLSLQVKTQIKGLSSKFCVQFGRKPSLAVILVGNNPASCIYVRNKIKACEEAGITHMDYRFDDSVSVHELLSFLDKLNSDDSIDGILVQLPLPDHIDENRIINSICPDKDVDGFTPANIGHLLIGDSGLVSCTPKGILRLLDFYGINTQGKNVCVIGRSNIVGKPVAALLMQRDRNATVTVCHTHTKNLKEITLNADIVISATGKAHFITEDMVKENAVLIDVGMCRLPDSSKKSGYRLVGDIDFENVSKKVAAITPVPGGVGPMTIAMLMENTLIAACRKQGIEVENL